MDKEYIKGLTQNVLNIQFKQEERRKIIEHPGRLQFCCPYCGDSAKNPHKKRGNLYLSKLFYICFNCDKKTTFDKFCKDFNQQIDPDKKLEMIQFLDNNLTYVDYDSEFIETKLENLIPLDRLTEVLNEGVINITDFKPIQKDSIPYKYLMERSITEPLHKNIYQAKYWKGEGVYENVLVFLNRKGDRVLGMQIRNLKGGKKRMFKIYNYETLYTWCYGEPNMDAHQLIVYNKLGYFFNILNVEFAATITIFEGFLDSLFYPNSIGLSGIGTDTKFLESNDLDLQFFYDNDDTGFRKSEYKLKDGCKVFLWKKLFNDIVEKKKVDDPYSLLNRISKVKDLNKLAELVKNPYKTLELENYFSNDIYDLKWIPKIKKQFLKLEKK